MAVVRNNNGKIVRGQGAELTELQTQFIDRIAEEGMECSSKIARELNYTSYYRDRRTVGTAFHRELLDIANGDTKAAMEAIKIINDMQGYKAPTKVQQTKIDVKATIDLTSKEEDEDIDYIDI